MGKRKIRSYTTEYKKEALILAKEIGTKKAALELDVPESTLSNWKKAAKYGDIDIGFGRQTPESAMTQAAEIQRLKAETKEQAKEISRLKRTNEILEEATVFFAASRQRSGKARE